MIAVLATLLLAPVPPGDTATVSVRVVRFFRTETGQTQVAAFIQTPRMPGGTLTLRVEESPGETLWEQSWERPLDPPAGDMVDHLRFTVAAGTYVVDVTVQDSTGQVVASTRAPVAGYATNPGISDLLLAPLIRAVHPSDTMPRAREFRRGALLITAPGTVRLGVESPVLHYLLEAYTPYGGQGTLGAKVRDAEGTLVREAPPAAVRVPAELGLLTGQIDLTGMGPGRYALVTVLTIGERRLEREAGFEVAAPVPLP